MSDGSCVVAPVDWVAENKVLIDQIAVYLQGRKAYLQKQAEVEKQAPGLMDKLWNEHLQALKFVQQAVGLRGYAQRDPLIEYKLEGYNLFLDMMGRIRRNVIYCIYQFQPMMIKNVQEDALNGSQPSSNDLKGSNINGKMDNTITQLNQKKQHSPLPQATKLKMKQIYKTILRL